jgi:hypothetical protein
VSDSIALQARLYDFHISTNGALVQKRNFGQIQRFSLEFQSITFDNAKYYEKIVVAIIITVKPANFEWTELRCCLS